MGLFERTHLPNHISSALCVAARVAVCAATDSWNLFPFVAAGCSEGRLQLRSRCVLEKSAVQSLEKQSRLSKLTAEKPCRSLFKLRIYTKAQACPPLVRRSVWRIRLGRGMGLFERTHLPDQNDSGLFRGPIRGLQCDALMESTPFISSKPQRGPLATQE